MFITHRALSASGSSRVSVSVIISASVNNYTLNPAAVPDYEAGKTDIEFIINSGVVVGSASTGSPALTITGFASGDSIVATNGGHIVGKGGTGANNNSAGGAGGTALSASFAFSITNNGTVGGGGGGGGGRNSYNVDCTTDYRTPQTCPVRGGGGGGGAGYGAVAWNGTVGALTTGGAGGSPDGGAGGSLGATGIASSYGGAGGAGGNYITGASYATWTTTGTRLGSAT
jgi:hypothetical protein